MKKTELFLVIFTFVGLSFGTKAQINLEHTFDGNATFGYKSFEPEINLHVSVNYPINQIKLYNEDYSLYKCVNINMPIIDGYLILNCICSKTLFNTNGKIAFLIDFFSYSQSENLVQTCRIYDEDGFLIKDLGFAYTLSSSIIKTLNGQFKLRIYKGISGAGYKTEIYSLPGYATPTSIVTSTENNILPPFPNPANAIITLPYQLKQGEMSVMNIYNSNGQLIETKQIGSDFDKILLNVSGYTKGMYVYEVNGVSNRFVVE